MSGGFVFLSFLGFIVLLTGFFLMIGGFIPKRLWNDHATLVQCISVGVVTQSECRRKHDNIYFQCFRAEIYTKATK